jgi:hypothetical protein
MGSDSDEEDEDTQKMGMPIIEKIVPVYFDVPAHPKAHRFIRRFLIFSGCLCVLALWSAYSLKLSMLLGIACAIGCKLPRMPVFRSCWLIVLLSACLLSLASLGHLISNSSNSQMPSGKKTHVLQVVEKSFPGAMSGHAMMPRVLDALRPYHLKPGNVIYGESLSPDEIHYEDSHISNLMRAHWGNWFPMGGLGGVPYVGKTGFAAFSHHVPDDGHVVILFGPHIGFSPDAEPGKFLRKGQANVSAACGSATAAYAQCMSETKYKSSLRDMEQSWLREGLAPHCGRIRDSCAPMVELAKTNYELIEKEIFEIVNTDFGSGNLVLIGGIMINMPYPLPGYFKPLHFSIRSASSPSQNMLSAFD